MEAIAKLKNCPSSPRKMRLVADLVRGMNVEKALFVLKYSNKQAARDIEKLLLSAVANWTVKNDDKSIDDVDLVVKRIFVDGGSQIKRFQTAPFGRPRKIRKRSNHITIIVDGATAEQPQKVSSKK